MSVKKFFQTIQSNSLGEINHKLSDYFWYKYNFFLEKYIGKIPTPEAWQGQWLAYHKIEKKYLNNTYDISLIFPKSSLVQDKKNIWIYWNSGIEEAPILVKKCFLQLQKNKPESGKF